MNQEKKKRGWVYELVDANSSNVRKMKERGEVILRPALRQLGTAPCPVCQRETAVFLTKTDRPFQNCGFCSARVFYNGHESQRSLKAKLKPIELD